MSLDDAMSRLLREFTERIAKERDPEKLQELVSEVNRLLDEFEKNSQRSKGPAAIKLQFSYLVRNEHLQ